MGYYATSSSPQVSGQQASQLSQQRKTTATRRGKDQPPQGTATVTTVSVENSVATSNSGNEEVGQSSASARQPAHNLRTSSTDAEQSPDNNASSQASFPASATIRGQSGDGWESSQPVTASGGYHGNATLGSPAAGPNNRYTDSGPRSSYSPQTGNPSPGGGYPAGGYPPNQPGSPSPYPSSSPNQQPASPPVTGPYGQSGAYGQSGGYGSTSPYASPDDYGSTIAPGSNGGQSFDGNSAVAPGVYPGMGPGVGPMVGSDSPMINAPNSYRPNERITPLDVYVQEARTGRVTLGGSVNSDLGVAGQLIIDERNFDIHRYPRSWEDLWSGKAFRGAGQNFRMEFMPGNQVERYTVSWSERNLLGYLPYSLSVGGFLYTRRFRDWTEQRLGGRVALGYEVTKDLSASAELRMEDVKLFDPRISGVPELDDALGSNDLYTGRVRVAHDTRDSPFMATEGALLELIYDQVFGTYDYPRGRVNYSRYFLMKERPDGTGRHTLASTWRFGFSGAQTPIFENFFAGGYSTMRGFRFRGASPKVSDVQVGGQFMGLGSLEYLFPLTADEMLRGVAFVDYGTIERDFEFNSENFRVAPGLGLRVAIPALGPAPLAFDFAYPVNAADTDEKQVFSFFMGFTR